MPVPIITGRQNTGMRPTALNDQAVLSAVKDPEKKDELESEWREPDSRISTRGP